MRERQLMFYPNKVKPDNIRTQLVASALMIDASVTSVSNMLSYFIQAKAIPQEAGLHISALKGNTYLLLQAIDSQLRDHERKELQKFVGMFRSNDHVNNMVEFCIQMLYGEKGLNDIGDAIKQLEKDIEEESKEAPKIFVPGVERKQ